MNAFMLLLCLSGVNAETEEVVDDPSAKSYKTYCCIYGLEITFMAW